MLQEENQTFWNLRWQCGFDFFSHLPPETCAAYLAKPPQPLQVYVKNQTTGYVFQAEAAHQGLCRGVASGTLEACHHGTVIRGTVYLSWMSALLLHLSLMLYILHLPVSCWWLIQAENFFWLVQGLVGLGVFSLIYLGLLLYMHQLARETRDALFRRLRDAIYQDTHQEVKG
jgi:hypothetical protein